MGRMTEIAMRVAHVRRIECGVTSNPTCRLIRADHRGQFVRRAPRSPENTSLSGSRGPNPSISATACRDKEEHDLLAICEHFVEYLSYARRELTKRRLRFRAKWQRRPPRDARLIKA